MDGPTYCPDCRQRLADPPLPVGWLGAAPVWCATCEDSRPGMGDRTAGGMIVRVAACVVADMARPLVNRRAFMALDLLAAVAVVVVLVLALLWIYVVGDYRSGDRPATVIERSHTAASTGFGVTSSGKTAFIRNPERWTLIVRDDEGNIYSLSVSAESWAAANPGDRINDPPRGPR